MVVAQAISGKFGYSFGGLFIGVGWLLPLWTPITTMLLVPLTLGKEGQSAEQGTVGIGLLAITYIAMLLYCSLVYLIIVLDEINDLPTATIFLWSTSAFLPVQTILIALLTKIFLE